MKLDTIVCGHCLDTLPQIPTGTVHCSVTSPPYYCLRKYAGDQKRDWPEVEYSPVPGLPLICVEAMTCALGHEPTIEAYVGHLVAIYREVRRVLRDDGVAWICMGDSYSGGGGYYPNAPSNQPDIAKARDAPGAQLSGARIKGQSRNMRGLQQGDLMLVPHRLALALQADGWTLRNDVVWCLSGGIYVYAKTQKGEMPMTVKDMVRLDPATVKLWNGKKWTQVLGWSETPRPNNPIEIELRSGEKIGCTPNHIWPTKNRGLVRAEDLQVGDIFESCIIPEPDEPRIPQALGDEDIGWFVGLYIAEGHQGKNHLCISGHEKEQARHDRLERIVAGYDGHIAYTFATKTKGCVATIHSPVLIGILEAYVNGTDAHNKHLHPRCWQRSNKFLRAVLNGYLSGDGHLDEKNNRWRIAFCRNYNLAQDLRTLCARLGIQLRLKLATATYQNGTAKTFRGEIRFSPNSSHYNTKSDSEIVKIGRSRARKFWDIGVEDEPHLFALASGVLTHNSKKAPMPESVSGWRWQRHRVKVKARWVGDHPSNFSGGQAESVLGKQHLGDGKSRATWQDCPGCPKCEETGGYVLRKGSWRHTRAHEFVFMLTKQMQYWSDQEAVREALAEASLERLNQPTFHEQSGGAKDYGPDSNRSARKALENLERSRSGRNPRSVLSPSPEPFPGRHFAVYPSGLITDLIKATCPAKCCPECGTGWSPVVETIRVKHPHTPGKGGRQTVPGMETSPTSCFRTGLVPTTNILGYRPSCGCRREDHVPGVVLDPFMGSGTTAIVAVRLGLHFYGCDVSQEYIDMAMERIEETRLETAQMRLL